MIGKSADSNSSNTNFLRWSEIKNKQTKFVFISFLHYHWWGFWSHANGDNWVTKQQHIENANKTENDNKILQRQENSNRIKAYRPTYKYFCS